MKYLPLIWSGIWRKPGRAILISLQVLIAFLLFGLLRGFKSGIDQVIAQTRADILIVHSRQSFGQPIPLAYFERIQAVPGVKAVFVQNYLAGSYQKPTQRIIADAIDPDLKWMGYPGLAVSKADLDALIHTRTGALVSATLARKYSWKVGDHIPLHSNILQQNGSPDWTAVLGVLAAWLLFNGNRVSPIGMSFRLTVTPDLVALGVAWALGMGLVGGLLPALRAARVSVTTALRAN